MLARGKVFSTRITVMIVDHEIPQLLVAGTTLYQQCGCRVLLAYGVEDALRRLASIVPDYLILDMDIPNVSGQEFLAKLPHFADVEIIPASAPSSQTGNLQSDTFQISGRLTRPYKPGTLIEEFRGIVPRPTANIHPGETNGDSIESEIRRILSLRH
jgi:DNA-binding response OmpR family regulator